jgi:hypothetical protein
MASVAIPARKASVLRSWASKAVSGAAGVLAAAVAPHRASLRRLADIPLTAAGTGFIDFAAFHVAHGWGFLVTGISLVVLEHMIADQDDDRR